MVAHRYTLPVAADADRELLAARLWAAGAVGVWEQPGATVAWFEQRPDELPGGGRWEPEPERDWQAAWRAGLEPIRAGRFVIVPSWQAGTREPGPGEIVIEIDPGRAFGSGHHPTTALCLEQLSALDLAGARVLDVGTGTGILAIAAARAGAAEIVALDHDPTAVDLARANLREAGIEAAVREADLDKLAELGAFDVVLANLHTQVLSAHAPDLAAALGHGGTLVVSGVVVDRRPGVLEAFARAGLGRPAGAATSERWVAIRWHRRGGEADTTTA